MNNSSIDNNLLFIPTENTRSPTGSTSSAESSNVNSNGHKKTEPNNDNLSTRIRNCANTAIDTFATHFNNAKDEFIKGVQHWAGFTAYVVGRHNGMQALAKFLKSTTKFSEVVLGQTSEGFKNLHVRLDMFDNIIELIDFIKDLEEWFKKEKEFADPNDPNVPRPFWKSEKTSNWKIVGKAFGTVSKGMGTINFCVNVGLITLGRVSAVIDAVPVFKFAMQFSPFKLVKDTLSSVQAACSIVEHSITVHKRREWLNSFGVQHEMKIKKWKAINNLRRYYTDTQFKTAELAKMAKEQKKTDTSPMETPEKAYLDKLFEEYTKAREEYFRFDGVRKNASKTPEFPKTLPVTSNIPPAITEIPPAITEILQDLPPPLPQEIGSPEGTSPLPMQDISPPPATSQDPAVNPPDPIQNPILTKWEAIEKAYMTEAGYKSAEECKTRIVKNSEKVEEYEVKRNKAWLAVAFNVAKLAAIIIGLTSVFVFTGTIGMVVTITVAWFITSTIGIARFYYDYRHLKENKI